VVSAPPKIQRTAPAKKVEAPKGPPDGRAFVRAALVDIRTRVAHGEKVRVAFDIDDTLANTRARTLHLAKEWDTANGTHYFDRLTLEQVGHDGLSTAMAMQLPWAAEKDFTAYWNQGFWDGANFQFDQPIPEMIELAKQARAAGAEVIYLTGRIANRERFTIDQLEKFGLPDVDASHVASKPDLGARTVQFKTDWLRQSAEEGNHLAFFITESRRDIAGIQSALGECPCVLLDSKFGGNDGIDQSTPIYPRAR
jgi:hypothetical protein